MQRPDGDAEAVQRPDGDVELAAAAQQGFRVPPCTACGGVLKPSVVFFGDGIPPERAQQALELAQGCRSMLVVGSSLAVWSAYRCVLGQAGLVVGDAVVLRAATNPCMCLLPVGWSRRLCRAARSWPL